MLLASCNNDPVAGNNDFGVKSSLIEISELGGECSVEYNLQSYVGGMMPAMVTTAEWITDIDNSTKGLIRFRVLPNFEA
jgi:hypothetical protein